MEHKYSVIDIETTGNTGLGLGRIIQWSVVLIENGKILSQHTSYINPQEEIPYEISKLTSITDETVRDAPTFEESFQEFSHLVDSSIIVGQNVDFDIKVIQNEVNRINQNLEVGGWVDTVELSRILFPTLHSYKLSSLTEQLGIPLHHPHLADQDAKATAELFLLLIEEWKQISLGIKKRLIPLLKKMRSDFTWLFEVDEQNLQLSELEWNLYENGVVFPPNTKEEKANSSYLALNDCEKALNSEEKMKDIFPLYEKRTSQIDFLRQTYQSWQAQKSCAFEVRPGIGKTFAYLVSGTLRYIETGSKLVISTSTKHLQNQIFKDQIPKVEKFLSRKINSIVMKGTSNYICVQKFLASLNENRDPYDILLTKAQILTWLQKTDTGDIDELNLSPGGEMFWENVCCSLECKKGSPHPCFYRRLIEKAVGCEVIIINHSLLIQFLKEENGLLGTGSNILIDEAHELERAIFNFSTQTINISNVLYHLSQLGLSSNERLLKQVHMCYKKYAPEKYANHELIDQALYGFKSSLHLVSEITSGMIIEAAEKHRLTHRLINEYAKINYQIAMESKFLGDFIKEYGSHLTSKDELNLKKTKKHFEHLIRGAQIFQIYLKPSWEEKWVEKQGDSIQTLTLSILSSDEVKTILKKIKNRLPSILFCSGTLFINGKEKFFLEGLNLLNEVEVIQVATEKKDSNVTVYLPKREIIPERSDEDTIKKVLYSFDFFKREGHRKFLILCNSVEMVRFLYEAFKQKEENYTGPILAQGKTFRSKEKLYQAFKSYEDAILIGAQSFYEGVDFPGDECTVVILPSLPFYPPEHPYVKIRQKMNDVIEPLSFIKILLPYALLLFRQAVGRLERSTHERGIFVLLDERIHTKSYKKFFMNTIQREKQKELKIPF